MIPYMANDFDDFLSSVKYLDKQDILDMAYKKHKALDKHSTALTTAQRVEFQQSVSDLLYWLETSQRPATIDDRNFGKLKSICENLVKNNQMNQQTLSLFK